MESMQNLVAERARLAELPLRADAPQKIALYYDMLLDANRMMNLTRVPDDPLEAVDRNVLDSLAPLRYGLLDGARSLIDVGAGAGFPGLLLAIALPDVRVTLIDSQGKRVKFLNRVIGELGLNALALHARAEDAARDASLRDAFDRATARAVAPLNVLLELALPFVQPGGALIAYKGPAVDAEAAQARRALNELGGRVRASYPAPIPGRDWDHRLLVVDKVERTPAAYPRKAGDPGKRPLV